MEEKKLKAMFFNGSPRKNKNTADMLQSAMRGAEAAGAECELVHLYDIDFKGCKSCFACKVKNSKTNGVCALKDDLRPILERCRQADVIVLGSPVYYSYPTGVMRSFLERLCFPVGTYLIENGQRICLRDKVIPTAMIFTMNCLEALMQKITLRYWVRYSAIPRLSTFITLINSVTIHATTLMLSQKRTSGNIVTSTMTST